MMSWPSDHCNYCRHDVRPAPHSCSPGALFQHQLGSLHRATDPSLPPKPHPLALGRIHPVPLLAQHSGGAVVLRRQVLVLLLTILMSSFPSGISTGIGGTRQTSPCFGELGICLLTSGASGIFTSLCYLQVLVLLILIIQGGFSHGQRR